jgi:hypothetical protein
MKETKEAIDELADSYALSQRAGQEEIKRLWRRSLHEATKLRLVSSKYYDSRGSRQTLWTEDSENGRQYLVDVEQDEDIENLEYSIGVLTRCVKAKLPSRDAPSGTAIPSECFGGERHAIENACAEIVSSPKWHEPAFLRLALSAIQKNQLAELLADSPPKDPKRISMLSPLFGLLATWIFSLGLFSISPIPLGYALVSAVKGNSEDTIIALYCFGFAFGLARLLAPSNNSAEAPPSPWEQAYEAWNSLFYRQPHWNLLGAGADFYLRGIAAKGVAVPLLAFDICAKLQALHQNDSLAKLNCRG